MSVLTHRHTSVCSYTSTHIVVHAHTHQRTTHQSKKGGGQKSDEHAEVTNAACKPFENASVPNRKKKEIKNKKKLEHGEVADAVINHKA